YYYKILKGSPLDENDDVIKSFPSGSENVTINNLPPGDYKIQVYKEINETSKLCYAKEYDEDLKTLGEKITLEVTITEPTKSINILNDEIETTNPTGFGKTNGRIVVP